MALRLLIGRRLVRRRRARWDVVLGVEKMVLRDFIWNLSRRFLSWLGKMSIGSPYSRMGRIKTL
jgi:hypothetical protein